MYFDAQLAGSRRVNMGNLAGSAVLAYTITFENNWKMVR